MYHIFCEGLYYGDFNTPADAEEWLRGQGWEEGYGKWAFYRPGIATVFATVVDKQITQSLMDLQNKIRY